MPTKPVKIDIPVAKLNIETFKTLPRLRLDSSNLLYLNVYKEIIERLRLNGIEVAKMEELIKPSSKKPKSQKTATIMVRSLWKLSISPINLEIRQQGFSKEVPSRSLVVVITGQAIGKVSMVPEYLNDILPEFLGVNNMATTGDIGVFLSNKDRCVQYLDVFLNTSLGQTILELSKYGTTNQHIDLQIFMRQYVPLILVNKVTRLIESAIEEYEAKAWRAYFKAMKIVEESLNIEGIDVGISRLNMVRLLGRLDSSALLALDIINKIKKSIKSHFVQVKEMFDIIPGNVPWSKEYIGTEGIPYVGTDAIDKSGIIDIDKVDKIPIHLYKQSFVKTREGDLLLVKDGVGSLGKIGIPQPNIHVRSGILVLRPKNPGVPTYYVATILKSKIYRKVIERLAYGSTGQLHLQTTAISMLEIPILQEYEEINKLMGSFVQNIYKSIMLKHKAVSELENQVFKLLSD